MKMITAPVGEFLQLFLPLLLLASIIAWLFIQRDADHYSEKLADDTRNQVTLQVQTIHLTFREILSDLRYLASIDALHNALGERDEVALGKVGREFVQLVSAKGIYDQVRYLDADGQEQVRSNLTSEGGGLVAPGALQNKADRYYFRDTLVLDKGEIFVSPLDLNIEQGAIELPYKPMIRFGMPLYDGEGEKRGVLLFNYLAVHLLNELLQASDNAVGEVYLLNRESYWLAGGGKGRDWGFMFPERKEQTFKSQHPEAWEQIRSGGREGQFQTAHGLYTYSQITPLQEGLRTSSGRFAAYAPSSSELDAGDYRWYVVSFLSTEKAAPPARNAIIGFYLLVLLTFVIGAAHIVRSRLLLRLSVVNLDAKVQELEETRSVLVQSEKMASLGRLVAGFAHEINTPIGVAVGAASHMQDAVTRLEMLVVDDEVDEVELDERMVEIRTAADLTLNNLRRASQLVLSFKRTSVDQSSESPRQYELREVIDDTISSLHNVFKRTGIKIHVDTPQSLLLFGRPGVYAQIITNLLYNSFTHGYAEGHNSGEIRIVATVKGDQVALNYSDDGAGINPDVVEHIFEPFYTTRRNGGGSGLGLYICYNLVISELVGTLSCASNPGESTQFSLHHPRDYFREVQDEDHT